MTATGTLKVDGQTISPQSIQGNSIEIEKRLNSHSLLSFSLIDKEGALYGTDIGGGTNWEDSMGKAVTFQHSDNTYQFIGRIERLMFTASRLDVFCQGESAYMRDYVMPLDMGSNFILLTGLVDGDPTNYQGVTCTDEDGNPPGWVENQFIYTERDIGVSFHDTDAGGEASETWDASAIATTGTSATSGAVADTNSENDEYYYAEDDSDPKDATVTFTIDGTTIPTSNDIQSITIHLEGIISDPTTAGKQHTVIAEMYDYTMTQWVEVGRWTKIYRYPRSTTYPVFFTFGEEGLKLPDPWASKFISDTNADDEYDQAKLRLSYEDNSSGDTLRVSIDYLAITVSFLDFTPDPPMVKVYGNSTDTLYLTNGIYSAGDAWSYNGSTDVTNYRGHAGVKKFNANGEYGRRTALASSAGGFELWMLVDNAANDWELTAKNIGGTLLFKFFLNGGNLAFNSNSGTTNCISPIVANTWYHLRCTWTSDLGDYKVSAYVDTVLKVDEDDFHNDSNVSTVSLTCLAAANLYMDAPGVGADSGYSLGDNLVPTGGVAANDIGIRDGDSFIVCPSTRIVMNNILAIAPNLSADPDPNFTKYFGRNVTGKTVDEVLRDICDLEGASWYEDYTSNGQCIIGARKNDLFDESLYTNASHAITTANYDWDFDIQREYNQYKAVRVYGNPNYAIDEYVEDTSTSNLSDRVFTIIDESISTSAEAYKVAYEQLQTLKTIQESIHLIVKDAYVQQLDAGKTVAITCARPTITGTYPIRKIKYHYGYPIGQVYAEVWLGLGETPPAEKLANQLEKGIRLARKVATDKLNPSNVIGTPAFSHTSLSNVTATQHDIPASIAAGIATHATDVDAHHTPSLGPPTDADVTYICNPVGTTALTYVGRLAGWFGFTNVDDTDHAQSYFYALPVYDGYHFVWKTTITRIEDQDAGDYVTDHYLRTSDGVTNTLQVTDNTDSDKTNPQTMTLDHADINCTGIIGIQVIVNVIVTNAGDLDIGAVSITGRWTAD